MQSANEVVVAAAGSGKTDYLLKKALGDRTRRVLVTTYTHENLREIRSRIWQAAGSDSVVDTMTWFEFLLQHGVKPYQSYKTSICRIRSINFVTDKPPLTKKADFDRYYFDRASNVYSDTVSDLACALDQASGGKVVGRLERIYDMILIDEMQDLAGYDLDFIQLLLKSGLQITMVGDPRQAVYFSNRNAKNKQYRGAGLAKWISLQVKARLCAEVPLAVSYRCNQLICDFADTLYPDLPSTTSANRQQVPDMGVHVVPEDLVDEYMECHKPQVLRWNKRNNAGGYPARNFGQVKGLAFNRVLIYPTSPIVELIVNQTPLEAGSAAKLYVAVTRARHSVGIVTPKSVAGVSRLTSWSPSDSRSKRGEHGHAAGER